MIFELLTEHLLEFLNLKGGCTGSSESTHVKMFEISCTGSNRIVARFSCIHELLYTQNLDQLVC